MTPRATDWGLALLVGPLFATGMMSLFAGRPDDAWVFAVHGAGEDARGEKTSVGRVRRDLAINPVGP